KPTDLLDGSDTPASAAGARRAIEDAADGSIDRVVEDHAEPIPASRQLLLAPIAEAGRLPVASERDPGHWGILQTLSLCLPDRIRPSLAWSCLSSTPARRPPLE